MCSLPGIKSVILGYEGSQQLPYIRSLVSQMSEDVSFTLLAQNEDSDIEVKKYLDGYGIKNRDISAVPLQENTMKWARELVMGVETPQGPGLVPYMYMLAPDAFNKLIVSQKKFHTVVESDLKNTSLPRGGWAVNNHDTVFISEGYFSNRHETESPKSPNEMKSDIERISGKTVLSIPTPLKGDGALLFNRHIDMWLAPMGPINDGRENVLVVGNPLYGARLSRQMKPEELYQLENDIFRDEVSENSGGFGDSEHPIKDIADYIQKLPNIERNLDNFSLMMAKKGYEIRWSPFLPLPTKPRVEAPASITYNNIHQQNFIDINNNHIRDVWVPDYDLPTLDEAGKKIYEELGFQTHPVSGMEKYVGSHGALRCLSVIGARGNYKETQPHKQS